MGRTLLIGLAALLSLVSCLDGGRDGMGRISVRVSSGDEDEVTVTRASAQDMVFAVQIINESGTPVYSCDNHNEMESPVYVRPGKYTVRAFHGDAPSAAFDSPFYEGSDDVSVSSGGSAQADIVCTLGNVKCTAVFDASVEEAFRSYCLEVSNGPGTLEFDSEAGTVGKEGYFSVTGTLSWKLRLVNNDGESFDSLSGTIDDVKARQHYRFKFTVDGQADGGSAVRVTIDELLNDREIDIDVPLDKPAAPVLSGSDFDMSQPLDIPLGLVKERTVSFVSEAGLKSAVVMFPDMEKADLVSVAEADSLALAASGLSWSGFSQGSKAAEIAVGNYLSGLGLGSYKICFATYDLADQLVFDTLDVNIIANVDAMAVKADAWAMFATLEGEWLSAEMPSGLGFEYRRQDEESWTRVDQVTADQQSKSFTAKVYMLEPKTGYVFRTVSDNDAGKTSPSVSFVTEEAGTIPNMNLDSWYKSGKTWYPKASASEQTWWDTANAGANVLSENNPTSPETSFLAVPGEGKSAARLETKSVLGVMAAGNLYTGRFKNLSGTTAKLDFGVPFTCRPLGLKGYYSYAPKTIDKVQSPYEDLKGKTDFMQIYLMLTDWDTPFAVSSDGTFVSLDDPAIIAYGEIVTDQGTDGQYVPFKIKLEYRDTSRKPKHAVIICCASRYGDYFTGAVGSVLYVDELDFIYDPLEFEE